MHKNHPNVIAALRNVLESLSEKSDEELNKLFVKNADNDVGEFITRTNWCDISIKTIKIPILKKAKKFKKGEVPKIGDVIYVDSRFYIEHGEDDFCGGLATVEEVKEEMHGKRKVHAIKVFEHRGHVYFWENNLMQEQIRLKKEFGPQNAHECPDIG